MKNRTKRVVEPKHSKLGASNAERWSNCPGSVALAAMLPTPPSSVHAAEGTVAHGLAESLVTGKITVARLQEMVGDQIKEDGFMIEVTDEMVNGVIEYVDTIAADMADFEDGEPLQAMAEQKVHAREIHEVIYGTADYIIGQKGRKLIVYDFKFGKKFVDARENKQMGIYAVGAASLLKGTYDEVELVIIQPRAGGVRRWMATPQWIQDFIVKMRGAAELALTKDAPINAGAWCRYCPAEANCPAKYAAVQKQAMVDFEIVPREPVKGVLPDVSTLSLAQISLALDWEDNINSWYEAIRLRIKTALEAGEEVPGYKLVEGKSNRQFRDEKEVVAEFSPLLGEDALYERKLLSPAKMERIVGKGKVDHLTFKPEGKKTIAKDTDHRPPARRAAEIDFAEPLADPSKTLVEGKDFAVSKPGVSAMSSSLDDALASVEIDETKKIWP